MKLKIHLCLVFFFLCIGLMMRLPATLNLEWKESWCAVSSALQIMYEVDILREDLKARNELGKLAPDSTERVLYSLFMQMRPENPEIYKRKKVEAVRVDPEKAIRKLKDVAVKQGVYTFHFDKLIQNYFSHKRYYFNYQSVVRKKLKNICFRLVLSKVDPEKELKKDLKNLIPNNKLLSLPDYLFIDLFGASFDVDYRINLEPLSFPEISTKQYEVFGNYMRTKYDVSVPHQIALVKDRAKEGRREGLWTFYDDYYNLRYKILSKEEKNAANAQELLRQKVGVSVYTAKNNVTYYSQYVFLRAIDPQGKGLLDLDHPLALLHAVRDNKIKYVSELLKKGKDLGMKDAYGLTPLHWASANGNPHILKLLLEHLDKNDKKRKQELLDMKEAPYQGSPIHLAYESGVVEALRLLLDHGANINIEDADGKKVAIRAAMDGKIAFAKMISEYALRDRLLGNLSRRLISLKESLEKLKSALQEVAS